MIDARQFGGDPVSAYSAYLASVGQPMPQMPYFDRFGRVAEYDENDIQNFIESQARSWWDSNQGDPSVYAGPNITPMLAPNPGAPQENDGGQSDQSFGDAQAQIQAVMQAAADATGSPYGSLVPVLTNSGIRDIANDRVVTVDGNNYRVTTPDSFVDQGGFDPGNLLLNIAMSAITGGAMAGVGTGVPLSLTGSSIANSAINGALSSTLQGGDPLMGAVTSGITGGLSPEVKSILDSVGITDPTLQRAITSSVVGGVNSTVSGGDPITGALFGAGNSLASSTIGSLFPTQTDVPMYSMPEAEWTSGYDVPSQDVGQSLSTSNSGWTSGYDLPIGEPTDYAQQVGNYTTSRPFGGGSVSGPDPDAELIAQQIAAEQAQQTQQNEGNPMSEWTSGYDVPSMDYDPSMTFNVGDTPNNEVLTMNVSDGVSGGAAGAGILGFLKSILGGSGGSGGAGSALTSLLGGGNGALLGTILGGILGSQSGAKQSGTITTVNDVPDWMKPYYQTLYGTAQAQSQQANQLNPQEQQAIDAISSRAAAGSPTMQSANAELQKTIAGDYLDPSSNPWLQAAYDRGLAGVKKALTPSFGQMQAFGQNSGYNQALARGAADLGTGIFGGNYQQERTRQANAVGQAPTFAQADYTDATNLLNAGQYKRNAQQQGSTFMSQVLSGSPFKSASQPYYTNPTAGILGGALTGATIGKGIFG